MLIRRPNQKYFLKKNYCYKEAAYSLDGEEKNQFAFGVPRRGSMFILSGCSY